MNMNRSIRGKKYSDTILTHYSRIFSKYAEYVVICMDRRMQMVTIVCYRHATKT